MLTAHRHYAASAKTETWPGEWAPSTPWSPSGFIPLASAAVKQGSKRCMLPCPRLCALGKPSAAALTTKHHMGSRFSLPCTSWQSYPTPQAHSLLSAVWSTQALHIACSISTVGRSKCLVHFLLLTSSDCKHHFYRFKSQLKMWYCLKSYELWW